MNKRSASIVALCSATFLQAYLLVSVFPYAAFMAIHFLQIHEEQAGPYAALFATSFMIGRTVTAHLWGTMADVYGRRVTMISSLVGSGLASLWFGITTSYSEAIIARGMIGALNSIVGVSKTVATELAFHDDFDCIISSNENATEGSEQNHHQDREQLETQIVGRVISMRAYGFLIAPAVAGFLADPLDIREKGLEHIESVEGSVMKILYYKVLSKYPYLLPNLLGAILCWISAMAVYLCIPETKPIHKSAKRIVRDFIQSSQNSSEQESQEAASIYLKTEDNSLSQQHPQHYESISNDGKCDSSVSPISLKTLWSRIRTRNHLIAYWLYSLVVINIDEAFPLYCISRNTGLGGLQEKDIGKILSASGVIFAIGQYKVYIKLCDTAGIYDSLLWAVYLGVLPVALFPLASLTVSKWWSMFYLALLSGITKVFQSAFFSSITVATNRTVPAEMRSRMNALGSIGAGMSKAFGPLVVGAWMAFCLSLDTENENERNIISVPIGSLLAWFGIALVSCLSMIIVLRSLP